MKEPRPDPGVLRYRLLLAMTNGPGSAGPESFQRVRPLSV